MCGMLEAHGMTQSAQIMDHRLRPPTLSIPKVTTGFRHYKKLKPHPRALGIPMSEKDRANLQEDIVVSGMVKAPLDITPKGLILDGVNRFEIAKELDMHPLAVQVFEYETEEQEALHAVTANLARRQLTKNEKVSLALQKVELLTELRGISKDRARDEEGHFVDLQDGQTEGDVIAEVVAEDPDVKERSLRKLKFIKQWRPDLAEMVTKGEMSADAAAKEAQKAKDAKELADKKKLADKEPVKEPKPPKPLGKDGKYAWSKKLNQKGHTGGSTHFIRLDTDPPFAFCTSADKRFDPKWFLGFAPKAKPSTELARNQSWSKVMKAATESYGSYGSFCTACIKKVLAYEAKDQPPEPVKLEDLLVQGWPGMNHGPMGRAVVEAVPNLSHVLVSLGPERDDGNYRSAKTLCGRKKLGSVVPIVVAGSLDKEGGLVSCPHCIIAWAKLEGFKNKRPRIDGESVGYRFYGVDPLNRAANTILQRLRDGESLDPEVHGILNALWEGLGIAKWTS